MKRLATVAIAGLLGGVVIHIVTVLAFPAFGGRDLWEAMDPFGPDDRFNLLPRPSPGSEQINYLDPNMVHAVCRLSLSSGPHRIVASLDAAFWSVGVFDRRGRTLFGISSQNQGRTSLDLLLIQPSALEPLRNDPPLILEQAEVVDVAADLVVVVLRAFVPDPMLGDEIGRQLASANCAAPFDLEPEPEGPEPELIQVPPNAD